MPELPEVESVVRNMLNSKPPLIGCRIKSFDLTWPGVVKDSTVDEFLAVINSSSFRSVSRYGKYLFFGLENAASQTYLALHLRMTGIVYINNSDQPPGPHNRFSIHLANGMALRFDDPRKFGRVWLVNSPSSVTSGLGPDALTVGPDEFCRRLRNTNRQLKVLLLDQSFVAGIGNIYADESLFLACLNPLQKTSELSDSEVLSLHKSVVAVLSEAVATDGANIDGVFKAGNYRVKVYGRQGKDCINCGEKIEKIRVGQRGTHFCPVCQPSKITNLVFAS